MPISLIPVLSLFPIPLIFPFPIPIRTTHLSSHLLSLSLSCSPCTSAFSVLLGCRGFSSIGLLGLFSGGWDRFVPPGVFSGLGWTGNEVWGYLFCAGRAFCLSLLHNLLDGLTPLFCSGKLWAMNDTILSTHDLSCLNRAIYLARNSSCLRRQVGCVLWGEAPTLNPDGPPGNYQELVGACNSPSLSHDCTVCLRSEFPSGEGYELCPAVHAEIGVIARAAAQGISTEGANLYSSTSVPCKWCAGVIVRAQIARVVCMEETEELPPIQRFGQTILTENHIEIVKVKEGDL